MVRIRTIESDIELLLKDRMAVADQITALQAKMERKADRITALRGELIELLKEVK
jgi:hypothetical protein